MTAAVLTLSGCVIPLPIPVPMPEMPAPTPAHEPDHVPGTPYESQTPEWTDCGLGFECATVAAPLDWNDPDRDSIVLSLAKYPAEGTPVGTLFVNPGGPGA